MRAAGGAYDCSGPGPRVGFEDGTTINPAEGAGQGEAARGVRGRRAAAVAQSLKAEVRAAGIARRAASHTFGGDIRLTQGLLDHGDVIPRWSTPLLSIAGLGVLSRRMRCKFRQRCTARPTLRASPPITGSRRPGPGCTTRCPTSTFSVVARRVAFWHCLRIVASTLQSNCC